MRRTFVIIFAALVTACAGSDAGGTFELSEFDITGPSLIRAGEQQIAVSNAGAFPHTLVVTNSTGGVVGATSLIQPGEDTLLEVDLDEGRYTFTCRIVAQNDEGEIVDHYEAGMTTMIEARG